MKLLTSFDDIDDAEKMKFWLLEHGIPTSIEGKHSKSFVHIPQGIGIYLLDDSQYLKAKQLLRKLDDQITRDIPKRETLMAKLKSKRLDGLVVAICTALLVLLILWIFSKVVI